ncbi:MAG TPA: hypothetical protein VF625_17925 [Longimicrobium sp.]|jgi:hypothetical protein
MPQTACPVCGAALPAGAGACPVCGEPRGRRIPNPWAALSVRTRSLLIGLLVAFAILAPAILFIFARHRSDPVTSGVQVRGAP